MRSEDLSAALAFVLEFPVDPHALDARSWIEGVAAVDDDVRVLAFFEAADAARFGTAGKQTKVGVASARVCSLRSFV